MPLDESSTGLNRDEREDLADRLYVLDHGEPIAQGKPEEVLRDPRVVEAYLGTRATVA